MSAAVIFGGYGVFGGWAARELARCGVTVVIAGRNYQRALACARTLGPQHRGICADLNNLDSCKQALTTTIANEKIEIAINCAGPFSSFNRNILDACLAVGCHYVDIADDRNYVASVRDYGDRFRQQGLTAAYGCSSLPAISCALALMVHDNREQIEHIRISLFIGNNNPKGRGAIRSAIGTLGRPIRAPQGIIRGFQDGELVDLPMPFGRRRVYNFESPEYDILPQLLGVKSVVVKVGFELRAATMTFALLARLYDNYGHQFADLMASVGKISSVIGHSGGAVMTELFYRNGNKRVSALYGASDGQRMAALPCVFAAQALLQGENARGALTAYELLGARQLLDQLMREGFQMQGSGIRED